MAPMIVDIQNNPDQAPLYRTIRKDTGEEIPYVFYADTEAGEVRMYREGDNGMAENPLREETVRVPFQIIDRRTRTVVAETSP